jgi:MFS family permease
VLLERSLYDRNCTRRLYKLATRRRPLRKEIARLPMGLRHTARLTTCGAAYSLASGGTATANSFGQLVFWRALVGFGLGGEWSAGAVLVSETWPPERRGRAIAWMQSGWALGYMFAAGVTAVGYASWPISWSGTEQGLLPMVELIEDSRMAIEGVIYILGRAKRLNCRIRMPACGSIPRRSPAAWECSATRPETRS